MALDNARDQIKDSPLFPFVPKTGDDDSKLQSNIPSCPSCSIEECGSPRKGGGQGEWAIITKGDHLYFENLRIMLLSLFMDGWRRKVLHWIWGSWSVIEDFVMGCDKVETVYGWGCLRANFWELQCYMTLKKDFWQFSALPKLRRFIWLRSGLNASYGI